MRFFLTHILLIFFTALGIAQEPVILQIVPIDKEASFIKKKIEFLPYQQDSTTARRQLETILMELRNSAYLAASIDSIAYKDSLQTAYLYVGEPYEWGHIENGNIDNAFISNAGFKEKFYTEKPLYYKEILSIQNRMLSYAENNGYPFANVRLDSVRVYNNKVYAKLYLDKNALIVLDELNIEGNAKISKKYLASYLNLNKGEIYNESKIKKVSSRIRETGYLTEKQAPFITFADNKATINLFLENKKSSQFDLLLGFLPKNNETGKLILTGNAKIDLQNPFGTGKEILLSWEQLRPLTQRLDVHFLYPYFLKLPFGFDINFDLYKRDTAYLDIIYDLGIQYHFEGRNYIEAFWNNSQTNILFVNTEQVKTTRTLPRNLDIRNSSFGLEYRFEQLDYRFNPTKGFDVKLRGAAGIKRISKNSDIVNIVDPDEPGFSYESLYDSLSLRSYQFKINADLAYYLPLAKRMTLKTGLKSGILIAERELYQNELYRLGGINLLRGFDDESVFASLYSILTTEVRFLIGQNSYLYGFGDFAYLQNKSNIADLTDWPLGFGVGMTFETKAGIFGISYALGRQQANPIDFGSGKIHFGYINRF